MTVKSTVFTQVKAEKNEKAIAACRLLPAAAVSTEEGVLDHSLAK